MVNFVDDAHFRRVWKHPKKTITPKQRAWVQYMLTVWGRINRGDDSPAGAINVIGRLMIRSQWSPDMGGHIERMVNWLYSDEGGALRGEALYKKARELVIPQSSASNIIALAKESDDAAFVEKVMVKLFHRERPSMFSRLLTICLMTMSIVSCAQTGPAKVEVIDTGCDWVNVIRLTEHDIEVMDRQTKKDVLVHNKSWQVNCQPNEYRASQ